MHSTIKSLQMSSLIRGKKKHQADFEKNFVSSNILGVHEFKIEKRKVEIYNVLRLSLDCVPWKDTEHGREE